MKLTYEQFFARGKAQDGRLISAAAGRNTALVVSDVNEPVPLPITVRTAQGVVGNLNVAGATNVRTEQDRRDLFDLVFRLFGGNPDEPFRLNRIALGSGGTRVMKEPNTGSMTAVEVPGLAWTIAYLKDPENSDRLPLTWGHTPRTKDTLGYGGEHSSFRLSDKLDTDTIPNPMLHVLWILQKSASAAAGWNGDLPKYIELLRQFADSGEGQSGLLVLSGGGVTAEEVLLALREGIPVLGAVGTGRAADALVDLKYGRLDQIKEDGIREQYQRILDEDLDVSLVRLFDAGQPIDGQRWLQEMGFGVIERPSRT